MAPRVKTWEQYIDEAKKNLIKRDECACKIGRLCLEACKKHGRTKKEFASSLKITVQILYQYCDMYSFTSALPEKERKIARANKSKLRKVIKKQKEVSNTKTPIQNFKEEFEKPIDQQYAEKVLADIYNAFIHVKKAKFDKIETRDLIVCLKRMGDISDVLGQESRKRSRSIK